ncbi:spermidine/putrescine ABC transporter substrate-binding protein [uncultured Arthrobacter sp.]|uniref:polyamine ABC transporter substrate-binding protein n=1 Tax=uncultured Arthrobacter sp. TaxID=114050 RepID=UPI00261D9299|nr:spermidine/putrescine ABC transporter substrate-binding protein [uncultured Arthrobacter sp.]
MKPRKATGTPDIRLLAPTTLSRELSRRSLFAGTAVVGLLGLAGCGGDRAMASSPAPNGKIENNVNLYSWGDYDPPESISSFTAATGATVQVDSFGSNEELISKLAATRGTSGYDVVVPTGLMIPQMAEHGLLQPLQKDLIPNFSNMDPNFTDQVWDPGNKYTICKAWGTTGYVYDTYTITRPMASWQDFLDAAMGEASGRTALLEDPWEVCSIALGAAGEDLNTTDEQKLDACERVLLDNLAPHVRAYFGAASTGMVQGGLALLQSYNGDARQGMLEMDDPEQWKFVYPTPSANLWMDNWAIATGAPHPDAAHALINHMISPEVAFEQMDYIGYPVGTKGLEERAEEEGVELPELIFPAQEVLDRLTPSEMNEAQQRRVEIFSSAQARSGA